jgi:hypothetical protein
LCGFRFAHVRRFPAKLIEEPSELDHAEAHCLCDRIGAADSLELVEK